MAKRKAIGKKTRFEVFKRDSFRCQYCGESAPDVVLQIDHIKPVSKGGDNDILNLITSCADCNGGKSNIELDDNTAIAKQRAQLEDLNERREQLEMMLKWREAMRDIASSASEALVSEFEKETGFAINESGKKSVDKWLKRYSLSELLSALDTSCTQYLLGDLEDGYDPESVEKAWHYIPRIAAVNSRGGMDETLRELYYIRGILRNRLHYCNDHQCIEYLKVAVEHGAELEELKDLARRVRNWTMFRDSVQSFLTMGEWGH